MNQSSARAGLAFICRLESDPEGLSILYDEDNKTG